MLFKMKIQIIIVLVWSACCHFATLYSSGHLLFTQLAMNDDLVYFGVVLFLIQGLCFVLYPVMGLVAEIYWTRYKVILIGTFVQLIGTVLFIAISFGLLVEPEIDLSSIIYIVSIPYALIQLGLGMIESNIIQFGTDQIIDRPSGDLSSFVHWYFWAIFFGHGVINCLFLILVPTTLSLTQGSGIISIVMSLSQAIACIAILFIVNHKSAKFEVEPLGENPVRLIRNVLVYAYHHPFPVNRSAFTYNDERTSRLDYGKTRFGGPFQTEEVEDVKSFFRVLLVFFGLLGFHLIDETYSISQDVLFMYNEMNVTLPLSEQPWFYFLTVDGFGISTFTILAGIPLYQLIVRRGICATRVLPSMSKRMFIGLVCVILAAVITLVLNIIITYDHSIECDPCSNLTDPVIFNYNFLIIPQVFNGLGFLFVFLTVMEFVLAQAPRRMQGLLIGIWYSLLSINLIMTSIESLDPFSSGIIPYLVIVIRISLMIIGIVMYICIAIRYKRRLRNELTDINVHLTIEQYTNRQLQTEQNIQEEEQMNTDYLAVFSVIDY